MILLDTHIWIWWMDDPDQLPAEYQEYLAFRRDGEMAVSAISCWEVAKLVELNRLKLSVSAAKWIACAMEPAITSIPIYADIALESTQLPGEFHKDPADRFIVATARLLKCPLVTMDRQIRHYPHVTLAP